MQKTLFTIYAILMITTCLSAQKTETVTIKAGARIQDCVPFQQRYRYPGFIDGKVIFKNGAGTEAKLNYNLWPGEMEYIRSGDTLAVANADEIMFIAIDNDTFFYDKGYLELICAGPVKVVMKQYYSLQQELKKDSYGYAGSNSAREYYGSIEAEGRSYKLISPNERVFEKKVLYFLATPKSGFVPFRKNKIWPLFPGKKAAIQSYLKSNPVDFNSRYDLLRFAGYLRTL